MKSLSEAIRANPKYQRFAERFPPLPPEPETPSDGMPACEPCGSQRYVRHHLPVDHADFGRAVPCPSCLAPHLVQQRLDRLFGELPPAFRDLTLDSCELFLRRRPDVTPRDVVRRLRQWQQTDSWLWLQGPVGLAKTSLAVALMRAEIEAGRTGVYRTVPRLLARLKQSFDGGDSLEALLGELMEVDVLLLDDLGKEKNTDWSREVLFSLVNERYLRRKRTLVTSNLAWWEVADRMDDAAVADRIRGMAGEYVIELRGASLRQYAA